MRGEEGAARRWTFSGEVLTLLQPFRPPPLAPGISPWPVLFLAHPISVFLSPCFPFDIPFPPTHLVSLGEVWLELPLLLTALPRPAGHTPTGPGRGQPLASRFLPLDKGEQKCQEHTHPHLWGLAPSCPVPTPGDAWAHSSQSIWETLL